LSEVFKNQIGHYNTIRERERERERKRERERERKREARISDTLYLKKRRNGE